MEFRLLGRSEIRDDGEVVKLGGPKQLNNPSVSPHDVISSGRICVKTSSPDLLLVAFNTSYW